MKTAPDIFPLSTSLAIPAMRKVYLARYWDKGGIDPGKPMTDEAWEEIDKAMRQIFVSPDFLAGRAQDRSQAG